MTDTLTQNVTNRFRGTTKELTHFRTAPTTLGLSITRLVDHQVQFCMISHIIQLNEQNGLSIKCQIGQGGGPSCTYKPNNAFTPISDVTKET